MNPDTLDRWKEECKFSFLEFEVLKVVSDQRATLSQIADDIYANRADGGPLGAEGCVYTYISEVNRKLEDRAHIKLFSMYGLVLDPGLDHKGIIIP